MSAASHDIGARNATENDQALEFFRVSLVTVLVISLLMLSTSFHTKRTSSRSSPKTVVANLP